MQQKIYVIKHIFSRIVIIFATTKELNMNRSSNGEEHKS